MTLQNAISAAISRALRPPQGSDDLTDWRYIRAFWYASRAEKRLEGADLTGCDRGIESTTKWVRHYGG